MSWKYTNIPLDQLPNIIKQIDIDVRNGNPVLDDIRCIYTLDDDNIIYISTVFDFVDLNPKPEFQTFSIGQMIKN